MWTSGPSGATWSTARCRHSRPREQRIAPGAGRLRPLFRRPGWGSTEARHLAHTHGGPRKRRFDQLSVRLVRQLRATHSLSTWGPRRSRTVRLDPRAQSRVRLCAIAHVRGCLRGSAPNRPPPTWCVLRQVAGCGRDLKDEKVSFGDFRLRSSLSRTCCRHRVIATDAARHMLTSACPAAVAAGCQRGVVAQF